MEHGKGVGCIVRRADEPIIVAVLEHGRVAVADEDLRMDILGQQGAPSKASRRMLDRIREDVRNTCSEIVRELAKEEREILLRRRRYGISLGAAIGGHNKAKAFTVSSRVNGE
jgi:hypothetical protein